MGRGGKGGGGRGGPGGFGAGRGGGFGGRGGPGGPGFRGGPGWRGGGWGWGGPGLWGWGWWGWGAAGYGYGGGGYSSFEDSEGVEIVQDDTANDAVVVFRGTDGFFDTRFPGRLAGAITETAWLSGIQRVNQVAAVCGDPTQAQQLLSCMLSCCTLIWLGVIFAALFSWRAYDNAALGWLGLVGLFGLLSLICLPSCIASCSLGRLRKEQQALTQALLQVNSGAGSEVVAWGLGRGANELAGGAADWAVVVRLAPAAAASNPATKAAAAVKGFFVGGGGGGGGAKPAPAPVQPLPTASPGPSPVVQVAGTVVATPSTSGGSAGGGGGGGRSISQELEALAALRKAGDISEQDYEQAKKVLLAGA